MTFNLILAATLVLLCLAATADTAKLDAALTARCEKEVREYLDVLRFIRDTAGSQVGSRVAAGYVDEKTVQAVQEKEGICAAAQLIRIKTGARRG